MRPMTPTTALLWRQWRETRWALFATVALATAMAQSVATIPASQEGFGARDAGTVALLAVTGTSAIFVLAVLFSHARQNRLTSSLTHEWLALPVRSARLAAIVVTYRCLSVAVAIAACIAAFYVFLRTPALVDELEAWTSEPTARALINNILNPDGAAAYFLIAIGAFAWIQAIEWFIRPVASVAAWIAQGVLAMGIFWAALDYEVRGATLLSMAAWTLPASVVMAFAGVIAQRRGIAIAWPNLTIPSTRRRDVPFATPNQALRWFEWRAAARRFTLLSLSGAAVLAPWNFFQAMYGGNASNRISDLQYAPLDYFAYTLALAVIVAFFMGLVFSFSKHSLMRGGASSAMAALPVPTQSLATAGFWAFSRAMVTIVCVTALVTVLMAITIAKVQPEVVTGPHGFRMRPSELLMLVAVMSVAAFTAFFGARFLIVAYVVALTGVAAWLALSGTSLEGNQVLALGYATCYVTTGITALFAAILVARRGHATKSYAAWVAGAAVVMLVVVSGSVWSWNEFRHTDDLLYAAACHAACVLPLVAWPAYLAWLRTR